MKLMRAARGPVSSILNAELILAQHCGYTSIDLPTSFPQRSETGTAEPASEIKRLGGGMTKPLQAPPPSEMKDFKRLLCRLLQLFSVAEMSAVRNFATRIILT